MEEEIGLEALGGEWIDPALRVADLEGGRGRLPILVEYSERYRPCRRAIEEDVHLVAKAEVLGSLAGIEGDLPFALACIPAEDLDDTVLEGESAESLAERLPIEHREVEPEVLRAGRI